MSPPKYRPEPLREAGGKQKQKTNAPTVGFPVDLLKPEVPPKPDPMLRWRLLFLAMTADWRLRR